MTEADHKEIAHLRESEEKYRKMIELANDAIFAIDPRDGTILEVNPKGEELTGYSGGELIGGKVWNLHPSEEEDSARKLFEHVVETGRGTCSEMNLLRKDGQLVRIEVSAAVITYGGRRIIQRICRDITERHRLKTALEEANQGLEQRVRERTRELQQKQTQLIQAEKMASLGNLVAGVAHEINTPLGALRSNTDLFMRTLNKMHNIVTDAGAPTEMRENTQLQQLFDKIKQLNDINQTASERIVGIVNSLRRFARLDQSEMDRVDIREGLENTLTLVNHELRDRITVVREYGDIPPISCFPNQLNQVFMNLLVNASQAIEGKGTITIRTRHGNGQVVVEFIDTGRGMNAETVKRIFDPGFTTKGSGVGTGLGLSIVYQIIEAHHGRIDVDSEPGRGAVIRLTLPVDPP
ncbi:MAG: PAS domain S-box protein [bacterium]